MKTKNMKFVNGALVAALMTLGVVFTACSNDDVDDLKNRMTKVEQNYSSQQTIINNLQEGIYVKGVVPITNGYELTLSNGQTLTIKNGEPGAAGKDGVDGKDGKDGKDGQDGKDGKDGDDFFKSIEVGTDAVVFTLADGTTFEMPIFDSFKKVRDRVQSIVYLPDFFDAQIGVQNDAEQTIRYQVKPEVVATYLADNRDAMQLVGNEVEMTRTDGAGFAITGASATRNGTLSLTVTPTGFEAQKGYAFALDIEADGSSYRTAYTPTFLIVEAEKIALGVMGLYPNMGVVTGGQYFQLYVVFFPDWTTSRSITWTSSDETRATVSPSGIVAVVDGAPDGEFTITATTKNGKKAWLTFNIVDGKLTIDTEQLHKQMEAQ